MKNKGILITISIIIVLLLLIISFNIEEKNSSKNNTSSEGNVLENAQKESTQVSESEKKEFKQINVDDYLNYYSNEDNVLILIARPTCSYCQIAEPILQQIAYENNIDINYLNTDNFSEDDYNKFIESNEMFTEGFGTPILLVVSNSQIVDNVDGLTDKTHYEEFLKKYKFID